MQAKKPVKLCDKKIRVKNKKFNEIMTEKIKEELDSKIKSYTNKEISEHANLLYILYGVYTLCTLYYIYFMASVFMVHDLNPKNLHINGLVFCKI